MSYNLSTGVIARIQPEEKVHNVYFQVLDIKTINQPPKPEGPAAVTIRLVVSDGVNYMQAVWTTNDTKVLDDNVLRTNSIIRINDGNSLMCRESIVIALTQFEVVQSVAEKIGTPGPKDSKAQIQQQQMMKHENSSTSQARNTYGMGFHNTSNSPSNAGPGNSLGSGGGMDGGVGAFVPIKSLNQYVRNWTLKVRVTSKSDIRTWSNAKGEGKLFSVDFLDQSGDQIRATMFNTACDKFFPLFQEGKVYAVSRGQVKIAKKNFSRFASDYDLTLDENSIVNLIGDDSHIKQQAFNNFTPLDRISSLPVPPPPNNLNAGGSNALSSAAPNQDVLVDVIGVVTHVSPSTQIQSKRTSRSLVKRDITIVDPTLHSIDISFWGEQAEKFNEDELKGAPVIAVKLCRVSDFNGRTLSTTFPSQVFVNPDVDQAQSLRRWYDNEGKACSFTNLSGGGGRGAGAGGAGGNRDERKSFADIDDEQIKFSNSVMYLTVRATVSFLKNERENNKFPWYNSCPECRKKVTQDFNQRYTCDGCNKTYDQPTPSYVFSFLASDYASSRFVSVLGKEGEVIFGVPASTMATLSQTDPARYDQIFKEAVMKMYEFRVRAKAEVQQDAPTVRCSVVSAKPVNFVEESKLMLRELQTLQAL